MKWKIIAAVKNRIGKRRESFPCIDKEEIKVALNGAKRNTRNGAAWRCEEEEEGGCSSAVLSGGGGGGGG